MIATLAISTLLIGQCGPNGCYAPAVNYAPIVNVSADPEWQPVASNAQQLALMAGGKQLGVYELDSERYFALVAGKWTEQPAPPIAPPARSTRPTPDALPVGDDQLFDRFKQRFADLADSRAEGKINARVEKLASEIADFDPQNPKKTSIIGVMLASAIVTLIYRVIQAAIMAIILAIVWAWFKKYILWVVGAVAVFTLGIIGISSAAGAHAGRKAAGR